MATPAQLRELVSEYARTTLGRYDVGEVLYRLSDHALPVVGVDGAGISLGDEDGRLRFLTATDDMVVRVEEKQVAGQAGPCHDAFETGEQVVVRDLRDEHRWGDYPAFAVEHGCVAVLGVPMIVGDRTIGALNLYRHEAGDWDDETLEDAQLVADMATGYIVNDRALSETRTLAEQLQRALETRIVIEQAKGILAERHRSDVGDAFQLLRAHARNHNERLHEVARAVVSNELEL